MKTNEICKLLNITKKAISYYEKKGLLSVSKDEKGYRFYSVEDINKLKEIVLYRNLGISTEDIKKLLITSDKTELLAQLEAGYNDELQSIIKKQYALSVLVSQGISDQTISMLTNDQGDESLEKAFVTKKLQECFPSGISNIVLEKHLELIALSYDKGIDMGRRGLNLYDDLPEYITSDKSYDLYINAIQQNNGSDSSRAEIKSFLAPNSKMKLIDLGCCLNLMFSGYDKWKSMYHGIDISEKTIELLNEYATKHNLIIGDLRVESVHQTTFPDHYFDIGTCIGVLEYFGEEFVYASILEMARILKPGARLVLDIPHIDNEIYNVTKQIEKYMGRENRFKITKTDFEHLVKEHFGIIRIDEVAGMLQYFLERII